MTPSPSEGTTATLVSAGLRAELPPAPEPASAPVAPVAPAPGAPSGQHPDPCAASAALETGTTDGAWYATLAPFEHFDSARTSRFPHTCGVRQIAGDGPVSVSTRSSVETYPNLYNAFTRERDQLYVYGGYVTEGSGAYVARLDPQTLRERWRVYLSVDDTGLFEWPGVAGVLGNGFIYAIAGNLLARIDAESGAMRTVRLPEHRGQGGAAYNGFDVSAAGVLFAKSLERGDTGKDGLRGLMGVARKNIPCILVALRADDLVTLARVELPEAAVGRVTIGEHGGQTWAYVPGLTRLWRYQFTGSELVQDKTWSPTYVSGDEQPGTGCVLMGEWVVVQTNFLPSPSPLRIWAFHRHNAARNHTFQPFPNSKQSEEWSKPGVDVENMRVYLNDQVVGQVACLDFDPEKGFTLRWQAEQRMASFWAVVGPREGRNVIGTDKTTAGDRVVWRDAATGALLASSDVLDPKKNANLVAPGFGGRYFYTAMENERLVEMTLSPG